MPSFASTTLAIPVLPDHLQASLGATYLVERELGRGGMALPQ